uniref:Uncharacterized protein n=1 Tax=Trichogramma kaykai TaxID=54128 RepID=A0ABD2WXQ7_9HYME
MYHFKSVLLFFVLVNVCNSQQNTQNLTENEIRPYEFTFNIADFQHRSEKRDDDGLISGEYGFITADGIYHETAYTTNKEGDFIVTKMKHRKVLSLKDAVDIYKDKPEQAKILIESMKRPCVDCETGELDRQESASFIKVETTPQPPRKNDVRFEKRFEQVTKEMIKILNKKLEDTLKGNAESLYTLKDSQKLPGYYNRLGKELNAPNKNATYEPFLKKWPMICSINSILPVLHIVTGKMVFEMVEKMNENSQKNLSTTEKVPYKGYYFNWLGK